MGAAQRTTDNGPRTPQFEVAVLNNDLGPSLPEWVLLMPFGDVQGSSRMVCDATDAERVINAFTAKGVDLVVDYEHQTLGGEHSSPTGLAPAAGWVKEMKAEPGRGLLGRTEWTHRARTAIAAREYRYLSPVMIKSKAGDRVLRMHSAGLTNKPAIVGMRPIVNSESLFQENTEMGELAKLLGLAPEATMDEIMAKVKTLVDGQAVSVNSAAKLKIVAEETGVAVDGEVEAVANSLRAAFNRMKNPPGKVDGTQVAELQTRLNSLSEQLAKRDCDELVVANAAKLAPSEEAWFRSTFAHDPAFARQWLAAKPALVNTQSTSASVEAAGGAPDRMVVINSARAAFRTAKTATNVVCSERAWVNTALRDKGLTPLAKEEADKLAIVVG